jgi:hypothetical protein
MTPFVPFAEQAEAAAEDSGFLKTSRNIVNCSPLTPRFRSLMPHFPLTPHFPPPCGINQANFPDKLSRKPSFSDTLSTRQPLDAQELLRRLQ